MRRRLSVVLLALPLAAWAQFPPLTEAEAVRLGLSRADFSDLEPGQRIVTRGAYLVKLAATRTGEIGHGHAH